MVIVRMPDLSRPFLINIAFSLEFYSPSFSIRCFPAPETYCIRGKHSRKYGICNISILDFFMTESGNFSNFGWDNSSWAGLVPVHPPPCMYPMVH